MISRPLIGRLTLRPWRSPLVWLPLVRLPWLPLIRLSLVRLSLVRLSLIRLPLIRVTLGRLTLIRLALNIRRRAKGLPVVARVRLEVRTLVEARALVELGRRAGSLAIAFRAIALSSSRVRRCRNERYRDKRECDSTHTLNSNVYRRITEILP